MDCEERERTPLSSRFPDNLPITFNYAGQRNFDLCKTTSARPGKELSFLGCRYFRCMATRVGASKEVLMLELVFTVCSLVSGASCHQLAPVNLQEDTTMMGCLMASQVEGAKWVSSHPNFYIQRATCQPAKTFAKI